MDCSPFGSLSGVVLTVKTLFVDYDTNPATSLSGRKSLAFGLHLSDLLFREVLRWISFPFF